MVSVILTFETTYLVIFINRSISVGVFFTFCNISAEKIWILCNLTGLTPLKLKIYILHNIVIMNKISVVLTSETACFVIFINRPISTGVIFFWHYVISRRKKSILCNLTGLTPLKLKIYILHNIDITNKISVILTSETAYLVIFINRPISIGVIYLTLCNISEEK